MSRFNKHLQLGGRWLKCGWRLFQRNPWLLGGMGACCAVVLFAAAAIPLIGSPLAGVLAPALLASFYLAVEGVAKQKAKLPLGLRIVALKQAPKEFLNIGREENRLMQVVMLGLYSLVVVVLTDVVVWLIAGTAWANRSLDTPLSTLPVVVLAGMIVLAIYFVLAASLVYTLPLAVLQHQPLVPAMSDSLKRSMHYVYALAAVLALLAAPLLLGAMVSFYSSPLARAVGLISLAVVLPVCVCSLYCSYRTLFPVAEPGQAIEPDLKRAKYVG